MTNMGKNFSLLKQGFGFVRALGDEFVQACERAEAPIEALHRIVTPRGRGTMDACVRLIVDHWQAEQPQPSIQTVGAGPYRSGTILMPAQKNVVVVSDLAAVDLTALTEKKSRLTHVDGDYRQWNYWLGLDGEPISGRGKSFEWQTWAPGREVEGEEVRKYFIDLGGYYGHTGAFTAWVGEHSPAGWHVTVPVDNGCWRHSDGGDLYVPYSHFDDGYRLLDRDRLLVWWDASAVFVGFREL